MQALGRPPLHAHVPGPAAPCRPGGHRGATPVRAVPGRATDPVHRRPRRLGSTRDGLLGQTVLRVAATARTPQPPRAPVGRCRRESADLRNDAAKFKLQFCRFLGRWSRLLRSAVYASVSCTLGKLSRGRAARTKRSNAGPGAPQATRAVRAPSLVHGMGRPSPPRPQPPLTCRWVTQPVVPVTLAHLAL